MKKSRSIKHLPKEAVYDEMNSPVGKLTLIASPEGLNAILWDSDCNVTNWDTSMDSISMNPNNKIIKETKKQLNEYFEGVRTTFDLPLVLNGTEFQKQAWNELLKIPYAKTLTYGEQAKNLGDKNKARAVGLANGKNPISIIIPCHRVVGSTGKLVGFAGGLDKKRYLIELEKKISKQRVLNFPKQSLCS